VGDDALYHRAERWLLEHSRSGRVTDLHKVVDAHFPDFDHVAMLLWQRHLRSRFGEFESLFRDAAKRTGIDWRLLAAVAYQESHWKPRAVSPTGVRGLMMLTQATAAQMGVTSRIDPAQSIDGGSRYLAHLLARVPKKVELEGRVWFAVASYNIGRGHVADAMMLTTAHRKNAAYWHNVRRYLPLLEDANYHRLTRHGYARGREPVRYVGNIRRYFDALRWERFREKLRRRAESTN
jgi:membrane-bound lytic murein transglycosylase F